MRVYMSTVLSVGGVQHDLVMSLAMQNTNTQAVNRIVQLSYINPCNNALKKNHQKTAF